MVKITRFDGWQWTNQGERKKKALRQVLIKYKLQKKKTYLTEHTTT